MENARSLDLVLREGMSLCVRRDGTEVAPFLSGTNLKIPLPGANPGSKISTIVIEYATSGGKISSSGRMRAELPEISFPCLSFAWDLVVPSGYEAVHQVRVSSPSTLTDPRAGREPDPASGGGAWDKMTGRKAPSTRATSTCLTNSSTYPPATS